MPILDKTAKIIVVEKNQQLRQMMISVLKEKIPGAIAGLSTLAEAYQALQGERIDWVVTNMYEDNTLNGLTILALTSKYLELQHLRVSFFINDDNIHLLPIAYEQGLLSHFIPQTSKDKMAAEFGHLFELYTSLDQDETRISGHYMRRVCEHFSKWNWQIYLDQQLLRFYPGDVDIMLHLAEALDQAGDGTQCKHVLAQALVIGDKIPDSYSALAEKYQVPKTASELDLTASTHPLVTLPIDSALVLDSRDSLRNDLVGLLKLAGIKNIGEYDGGEGAALAIDTMKKPPSLLIIEWAMPSVSGPVLVQRFRHKFPSIPTVVICDQFSNEDRELVLEMGVDVVIESTHTRSELLSAITYAIRRNSFPSDLSSIELKMRSALEVHNMEEANELRDRYNAKLPPDHPRHALIAAEFFYAEQKYEECKMSTIEALKSEPDSVIILNLLGKCFMQLQDAKSAIKCFEKAKILSPKNIARVCQIAVAQSTLGNKTEAKKALEEAATIDPNSPQVQESTATIHILEGNTEEAKKIMKQLDSLKNIIGFMNNQAIALSKSGYFENSLDLYQQTLDSLPAKKTDTIAKVRFNLGFAYLRAKMLEKALEEFELAAALEIEPIKARATAILTSLKKAIKDELVIKVSDSRLILPEDPIAQEQEKKLRSEQSSHHRQLLATLNLSPGDLCLYRIYKHPERHEEEHSALLTELPPFKKRKKLVT